MKIVDEPEYAKEMKMNNDNDKYAEYIKSLNDALSNPVGEKLLDYLNSQFPYGLARSQPKTDRLPIGLISKNAIPAKSTGVIEFITYVTCKPYCLILSDETAKSFNASSFKCCAIEHNIGEGNIPLDTFAVDYYANSKNHDKLVESQTWDMATLPPGGRLQLHVKNITDKAKHFRGIFWAKTLTY